MSVNSSDFLVVFCWTEREKSETEMLRPMLYILNVDIFLLRNFRQTVWLNIFNWNSQTLLTNFRTFHHKHQHLDNNYTSSSLLSSLQRIVGKLLAHMTHGFILLPTWAWKGARKVERNCQFMIRGANESLLTRVASNPPPKCSCPSAKFPYLSSLSVWTAGCIMTRTVLKFMTDQVGKFLSSELPPRFNQLFNQRPPNLSTTNTPSSQLLLRIFDVLRARSI